MSSIPRVNLTSINLVYPSRRFLCVCHICVYLPFALSYVNDVTSSDFPWTSFETLGSTLFFKTAAHYFTVYMRIP
jgi:hypothetical protein